MRILGAIVLVVASFLWAALVGTIATMNDSDPAGNGLSRAYAAFIGIALWLVLSGLLIVAGIAGRMPGWAAACAILLVPASGAAALASIELLSDSVYHARWPLAIPILGPGLIVVYAIWNSRLARAISGVALLALSIVPWPVFAYRSSHRAADRAGQEAEWNSHAPDRVEAERRRNLAAFQKLTPQSPLRDWTDFTLPGNVLREQALEGIRHLNRRQSDAVVMLRQGYDFPMREMPQLALDATPVLCDAANKFIWMNVEPPKPRDPSVQPPYAAIEDRIDPYLPGIEWLVSHGCDFKTELADIDAGVRLYENSPRREQALKALAELQKQSTGR